MAYGLTQSLDLERSSAQYATISDAAQTGLDFATDFTIETWINLESLPASLVGYSICGKFTSGNRQYHFYVYNSSGTYQLAWNWTVGGIIYLSTTPGALTQTAPSATDDVVRVCGWAVNADTVFWNPSPDFITIV